MKPIILNYFTKGTGYEKEAAALKASCDRFGLPHMIEGIEPFGKWFAHAAHKASFIYEKMKLLKRPVLWIDADAEVVGPLDYFSSLEADMALRIYPNLPQSDPSYYYSGTLYFDYNPLTLDFVKQWADELEREVSICPEGREIWDQTVLKWLHFDNPAITLDPLSPGYAAIFDSAEDLKTPNGVYIIHYQASRLYKQFINGRAELPQFLDQLSIQELRALRPRLDK